MAMIGRFGRFERIFVGIALVASGWLNWQLGQVLLARNAPTHLALGSIAPRLQLLSLDERPVTVDFADVQGAGTIVYYMSPTCPWCARNEASIAALATQVAPRFRVLAVGPVAEAELIRRKVQRSPTTYPVYLLPESTQNSYLLRSLPTTLVIDTTGVVLRAWPGAYTTQRRTDLQDYFEVPLPDAAAPAAPVLLTDPIPASDSTPSR
jgi:hypothetical protein